MTRRPSRSFFVFLYVALLLGLPALASDASPLLRLQVGDIDPLVQAKRAPADVDSTQPSTLRVVQLRAVPDAATHPVSQVPTYGSQAFSGVDVVGVDSVEVSSSSVVVSSSSPFSHPGVRQNAKAATVNNTTNFFI